MKKATCDLVSAIKEKTILLTQAARQVRIIVSGGAESYHTVLVSKHLISSLSEDQLLWCRTMYY